MDSMKTGLCAVCYCPDCPYQTVNGWSGFLCHRCREEENAWEADIGLGPLLPEAPSALVEESPGTTSAPRSKLSQESAGSSGKMYWFTDDSKLRQELHELYGWDGEAL